MAAGWVRIEYAPAGSAFEAALQKREEAGAGADGTPPPSYLDDASIALTGVEEAARPFGPERQFGLFPRCGVCARRVCVPG